MTSRKIFLGVCAILCISVVAGFVIAYIIANPVKLTDEEILYYANTAEKVWYEGVDSVSEDDSMEFEVQLKENKIKILPRVNTKQSITVDFSNSQKQITVNKPIVSFWERFFVYSILICGTLCLFGFGIFTTKEVFKEKCKK